MFKQPVEKCPKCKSVNWESKSKDGKIIERYCLDCDYEENVQ
ncbi:MAG: hypothetical protein AABY22_06685 [Nanoarchaeota archaeon]